jgi:predicted RecA/RadA family phage recombinase
MDKLMQIHPDDNVLVIRKKILSGDKEVINGMVAVYNTDIELGHKVAAKHIDKNELIVKYGVPIGSAIEDIETGDHVHLHNMKSDYISTFLLDNQFKNE